MGTTILTVPNGMTGQVRTAYGNYTISSGQVTVDSRAVPQLLQNGFSGTGLVWPLNADATGAYMTAPSGFGELQDAAGTRRPIYNRVRVTRDEIMGLYAIGFTVDRMIYQKMVANPPLPTQNLITIDLNTFDPSKPFPGWDGKKATQEVANTYANRFPSDRDILIKGHESQWWSGEPTLWGGRIVHLIGGSYTSVISLRRLFLCGIIEGTLVRIPYNPRYVRPTGDAFSIWADLSVPGVVSSYMLNNRVDTIDGAYAGVHGDMFQIPYNNNTGTTVSTVLKDAWIERLSGTTVPQGLMLAQQRASGASATLPQRVTVLETDVAMAGLYYENEGYISGNPIHGTGNGAAVYLIDADTSTNGGLPYPISFEDLYVTPYGSNTLIDHLGPKGVGVNSLVMTPVVDDLGRATYDPATLVDGYVQWGPRPGGDIVPYNASGVGGFNIPGMGYSSPGYGRVLNPSAPSTPTPYFYPDTYNPLEVSGIFAWLDPNQADTVVLSGSTITSIADRVSGKAFVQDGSNPLPTLLNRRLGWSYRNTMSFPSGALISTDASISSTFGGVNKPFTIAAIVLPVTLSGFRTIAFFGRGDSGQDGMGLSWNSGKFRAQFTKTGTIIVVEEATASSTLTTPTVVMLTYDGTVASLYVNGLLKAQNLTVSQASKAINNLCIGGNKTSATTSSFWNGIQDEVLVFSRALTANERRDLTTFLTSKAGLAPIRP